MKRKILIIIFLGIISYALWNARNFILGPKIEIISPLSGEKVVKNPIEITGKAKNISFISLNGRQIFIDKDNNFSETVLLLPGENIVEIFAKDRFNKTHTVRLLFYNNLKPLQVETEGVKDIKIEEHASSTSDIN